MSLSADPPSASVPAGGGSASVKLANGGAEKLVFKVKSSNNTEYRIQPVFGFADAGGAAELKITRLAGPPKEDKLVVYFGAAPADATDANAAFAAAGNPTTSITIPLSAA